MRSKNNLKNVFIDHNEYSNKLLNRHRKASIIGMILSLILPNITSCIPFEYHPYSKVKTFSLYPSYYYFSGIITITITILFFAYSFKKICKASFLESTPCNSIKGMMIALTLLSASFLAFLGPTGEVHTGRYENAYINTIPGIILGNYIISMIALYSFNWLLIETKRTYKSWKKTKK